MLKPVHYLLCESSFDGLYAQAVLYDGSVQELNRGCFRDLRIEGALAGSKPVAIALTASGYEGLKTDVLTYYSGNRDGVFLPYPTSPLDQASLEAYRVLNGDAGFLKGGSTLVVNPFLPDGVFDPKPDRSLKSPHMARSLVANDLRYPPSGRAYTATVVGPGTGTIDAPGCGQGDQPGHLRVETGHFENGLLSGGVFSRIIDADTGTALLDVPYTGHGTYDGSPIGPCRLRATVDSTLRGRNTEILRYRISFQQPPR